MRLPRPSKKILKNQVEVALKLKKMALRKLPMPLNKSTIA